MSGAVVCGALVLVLVMASGAEPAEDTRGLGGFYVSYQRAGDAATSEGPRGPVRGLLGADDTLAGPRGPMSPARGPRGLLGADDTLLEALAGARGGNRLVVCGACRARSAASPRGPCLPQRCPGVAWRHRWALVRASCVAGLTLEDMRVLSTTKHERTCDALEQEPLLMARRARRVVWGRMQPLWRSFNRGYDVALLELDRPFGHDEPLANSTSAEQYLQHIKYWMENTNNEYWKRSLETTHYRTNSMGYTLLVTGILPATTLFMFFLFIIFGTGKPIQVQYSNQKDGIKTPWMIDGYSSDVRCFPTYGQV